MKNIAALLNLDALYIPQANIYTLRMVAYLGIACMVLAGWLEAHFGPAAPWLAGGLLLFPHLSQLAASALKNYCAEKSLQAGLVLLDALLLGMLISWMGFSLLPTAVQLIIVLFYALLRREPRFSVLAFSLIVLTSCLTQMVLDTPPNLQTPIYTTLTGLGILMLQLWLSALFLRKFHLQAQQLEASLLQEQDKNKRLGQDLAKYLSPQVWQMMFNRQPGLQMKTRRKKLTVFFSDIKGFTDLSEELEPEALAELLNNYLTEMSKIATRHGGTIDKFIGDSVMVFFGDPHTKGAKQDALAAVAMALDMRKQMGVLRQKWQGEGIHGSLQIRMGINTGYCTAGSFGADSRMDYTIIGREVNLASRLESAASANEILISGETYNLVKDVIMGRDKGHIQVKGFARPVQIFQVVDYRSDLGPSRSYLSHEIRGFSLHLDTGSLQGEEIQQVIQALNQALEQLGE